MTTLVTRCPKCDTAFRVQPTQLSARGGKVRCGRCSAVFDGIAQLAGGEATISTPERSPQLRLFDPKAMRPSEPAALRHDAEPGAVAAAEVITASAAEADGPAPTLAPDDGAIETDAIPAELLTERESAPPSSAGESIVQGDPPAGSASAEPADAAFLGAKARGRRGTWLWAFVSVLALVLLAAQAALRYRNELSVWSPVLREPLDALCEPVGCVVGLPRRVELLAIESSDLQSDPRRENLIILSALLRNRAPFPQAYPALELTLTDENDQAVVRRVLRAADYLGAARSTEAAGIAAEGEAAVRVEFDSTRVRAIGYRLYLFYP